LQSKRGGTPQVHHGGNRLLANDESRSLERVPPPTEQWLYRGMSRIRFDHVAQAKRPGLFGHVDEAAVTSRVCSFEM
jgi:hypothetical protein